MKKINKKIKTFNKDFEVELEELLNRSFAENLYEKKRNVKLKHFHFVEFNFDEMFETNIKTSIIDKFGFRLWINEDETFEIQYNNKFSKTFLNKEEVLNTLREEAEKIERELRIDEEKEKSKQEYALELEKRLKKENILDSGISPKTYDLLTTLKII
jgi:hypothetical protein